MSASAGQSLGDLMSAVRRPLFGRDELIASLASMTECEAPVLAYVRGVAGIGKSSLLLAVAARARERGVHVVALDGGAVEPTDAGFLEALGRATDLTLPSVDVLAQTLPSPLLLVLDTYEWE